MENSVVVRVGSTKVSSSVTSTLVVTGATPRVTPSFRHFGVYLDDITPLGETFGSEIEAVDAKREILQDEVPVCGNLEIALVSVALAEEFATGRDAGSFGIAYFEM